MGRDGVSDTAGPLVPNSVPGTGTGFSEREGGRGSCRGEKEGGRRGEKLREGRTILITRQTTDPKNMRP